MRQVYDRFVMSLRCACSGYPQFAYTSALLYVSSNNTRKSKLGQSSGL